MLADANHSCAPVSSGAVPVHSLSTAVTIAVLKLLGCTEYMLMRNWKFTSGQMVWIRLSIKDFTPNDE